MISEHFSNHPLALAIKKSAPEISDDDIYEYREIAGSGITARTVYGTICAGNRSFIASLGIHCEATEKAVTAVFVSLNGKYIGAVYLGDSVKHEAKSVISRLKEAGIGKTVMLTGDREDSARAVADRLGIDEVRFELLPADKVFHLEDIMKGSADDKVIYVGDGINDAPVIMRSDIGIAMGALGSDAALEAADIVLMNDDLNGLVEAIKISKKTRSIVIQNITIALGVKFAALFRSAAGIAANMWLAVFADVGVLILAVLNAMRNLSA